MKRLTLLFLLFFLPACTAATRTSELYYRYISPTPVISLDNKKLAHGPEFRFSRAIMPVDSPFNALLESMAARDHFPDTAALQQIFQQYPWLENVGVFDTAGKILEQIGPDFQVNTDRLLAMENPDERRPRLLRDSTGLFVLLHPVYADNIWAGFKAASFRPDKLMGLSAQADQLALFLEDSPVFCGPSFSFPETMRHKLQKDRAPRNRFQHKDMQYCWLRRNIGGCWLIYAYAEKS